MSTSRNNMSITHALRAYDYVGAEYRRLGGDDLYDSEHGQDSTDDYADIAHDLVELLRSGKYRLQRVEDGKFVRIPGKGQ